MVCLNIACVRNAKHGNVRVVLVNLCFALLLLGIALFAFGFFASTEQGCKIANVIRFISRRLSYKAHLLVVISCKCYRYYLVFVTLLWNAVEAANMYLMLIKVFNSDVRHFALKAVTVAWGELVLGALQ